MVLTFIRLCYLAGEQPSKKVATVSGGTTSERFGFVQRYRELGVTFLCDWLDVTRSGFYAWEKRKASQRFFEDQRLKRIAQLYWQISGRYGSPRIFKTLVKEEV